MANMAPIPARLNCLWATEVMDSVGTEKVMSAAGAGLG